MTFAFRMMEMALVKYSTNVRSFVILPLVATALNLFVAFASPLLGKPLQDAAAISKPQVDQSVLDAAQLETLLDQLDSDQFVLRQKAMHQLWSLGPQVTAIELYRLQQNGTLESKKRAEALLHRFRIGLVPGMDPELAKQIVNFQQGSKEQKRRCIDRLLKAGQLRSAFALWRDEDRSFALEDESVYLQHWLRNGLWSAIDEFYDDAEASSTDLPSSVEYYRTMGQLSQRRSKLNHLLSADLDRPLASQSPNLARVTGESQNLTVESILGGPELSRENALRMAACLDYFERDYQQSLLYLQQMDNSQDEQFQIYYSLMQYAKAAETVSKLEPRQQRQFVLPEEGVARQYCEALLYGFAGNRMLMKEKLLQHEPNPDQLFTYACALMSSGDQHLIDVALNRLKDQDAASAFELYCDLERWDLAFAEVGYPIDADEAARGEWLTKQLSSATENPQEFRRSSERATLLALAETLASLGLPEHATQILDQLVEVPSETDMQLQYSKIGLCRMAISMGLFDWAFQQSVTLTEKLTDEEVVSIWFAGDNQALFWYRLCFDEAVCEEFQLEFAPADSLEGFQQRMALIGRLIREPQMQAIQPARFMDLSEVERFDRLAIAISNRQNTHNSDSFDAVLRLRWDYQQFDRLAELCTQFPNIDLSFDQRLQLAMSLWQSGKFRQGRRCFWQLYWENPEVREAMIYASLPDGFDLFQFVLDQPSGLDQQQLLNNVRPWELTPEDVAEGVQLISARAVQIREGREVDWEDVSDREIMLTARLHYVVCRQKVDTWMKSAYEFQQIGCDRLAAWQTLEFKVRSMWFQFRESSWAAGNMMLIVMPNVDWQLEKHWRTEMATSAMLSYPIGKIGAYAMIGAKIRTAELRAALLRNDLQAATEIANEIRETHPYDIDVVQRLTEHLDAVGRSSDADAIFETSFSGLAETQRKFPNSSLLANNLAWMCVQGNRKLDLAESLVSHAMQLEPGTPNYPDTLADVLWKQGRNDEAKEMNQLSRRLAPTRSYYRRQTQKFNRPYTNASIR